MPPLTVPLLAALAVVAAASGTARADERDCDGYGALSDRPALSVGRIADGAPRSFFVRNGAEAKACPNATDACRARAFLVPGNRVILGRTRGAFVCADYIGAKGADRAGWLSTTAVVPETAAPIALADWTGTWARRKPRSRCGRRRPARSRSRARPLTALWIPTA